MCAYKLCRVEFRYWGMQTKIERFIDDTGKFKFQSAIKIQNRKRLFSAKKDDVESASASLGVAGRVARTYHGGYSGDRKADAVGSQEEDGTA